MANILLVDDDTSLLELGKEFIERSGQHTVITAESLDLAMRYVDVAPIDVIVSDLQMPGGDGIEFLTLIRKRKERIPFILFTGKGREEVVIEAINKGADFYIKKDTDVRSQYAQLMQTIDQAYMRKQAEDTVDYNLNMFKRLIENSTDIIAVVDDKGAIEYVSPSVNRIFGYREEELIGRDGFRFLRPEMREFSQLQEADDPDSPRMFFTNVEAMRKDGSWATVEYVVKPFDRDHQKKFVINIRDISERVEHDRQMQTMMRQIGVQHSEVEKESQKGLVGGITYDISTSKARLTPKAANIFGIDAGPREFDVLILETMVHPDDRKTFSNAVVNAPQTPEPAETRFRIILPSGEIRNINMISSTMMDMDNVPMCVHGVIRDCTEMVRLQERIMMANKMQ